MSTTFKVLTDAAVQAANPYYNGCTATADARVFKLANGTRYIAAVSGLSKEKKEYYESIILGDDAVAFAYLQAACDYIVVNGSWPVI
jgi:hypothetical protein